MRPKLFLDPQTVADNALAWSAFAGVPIYAVVKCDGYGWGYATMLRALAGVVETYCVSDEDELQILRRHTSAPAIVLGEVPVARLRGVLEAQARPTISSSQALDVAADWARSRSRPLLVRVGVRTAAAWSGLALAELASFAPALASARAQVEVWTHLTDLSAIDEQLRLFDEALDLLRRAGVIVRSTDVASTLPLARGVKRGEAARIGIGLFGATGGATVPSVRCALNLRAPVLRVERHSAGTRLGYGGTMLGMDDAVAITRGGYGDGLPASLQGTGDVLSVGMQYAMVRAARLHKEEWVWLDRESNLDSFAAAAGRPVHEVVTTLGNCARAASVATD